MITSVALRGRWPQWDLPAYGDTVSEPLAEVSFQQSSSRKQALRTDAHPVCCTQQADGGATPSAEALMLGIGSGQPDVGEPWACRATSGGPRAAGRPAARQTSWTSGWWLMQ